MPDGASGLAQLEASRMNIFALNIALAVAWAALTGNITLSGWSSASRFGSACLFLTRPCSRAVDLYFKRAWRWAKLCVLFLYELVVSSVQVIWDVLTPQHKARPGIIAMPLDAEGRDGGSAGHQPHLADPGHPVARRDG
jgi:multicomponent Na+:H+ antiporter subunit E